MGGLDTGYVIHLRIKYVYMYEHTFIISLGFFYLCHHMHRANDNLLDTHWDVEKDRDSNWMVEFLLL